jgi:hypothetical protein
MIEIYDLEAYEQLTLVMKLLNAIDPTTLTTEEKDAIDFVRKLAKNSLTGPGRKQPPLPPAPPGQKGAVRRLSMRGLLKYLFPYFESPTDARDFIRFVILRAPWFNVFLTRWNAALLTPVHGHGQWYITCILRGGYHEYHDERWTFKRPGRILWRPTGFRHSVVTNGGVWSLMLIGKKKRKAS